MSSSDDDLLFSTQDFRRRTDDQQRRESYSIYACIYPSPWRTRHLCYRRRSLLQSHSCIVIEPSSYVVRVTDTWLLRAVKCTGVGHVSFDENHRTARFFLRNITTNNRGTVKKNWQKKKKKTSSFGPRRSVIGGCPSCGWGFMNFLITSKSESDFQSLYSIQTFLSGTLA